VAETCSVQSRSRGCRINSCGISSRLFSLITFFIYGRRYRFHLVYTFFHLEDLNLAYLVAKANKYGSNLTSLILTCAYLRFVLALIEYTVSSSVPSRRSSG
jgi:hypothetical protein